MAADRHSDLFAAAEEVIANSRRSPAAVAGGAKLLGTPSHRLAPGHARRGYSGRARRPSRARLLGAVLYVRRLASMDMKLRRDLIPSVERRVDGCAWRCSVLRS